MGHFFPTTGEVGISFRNNRINVLAMRWAMRQITYISHVWCQWGLFFCVATFAIMTISMKPFLLWYFHFSRWPNGLCHLGDEKCEEVVREVNYIVFVISSNMRCAGTQCLQLHDIIPLPQDRKAFTMMVVHVASDAFVGTVAQAVTFMAYAQVKVEVAGWIYHLAGQQQFGFSSYCININL